MPIAGWLIVVVPRADVAEANDRVRDDDPSTDDKTFTLLASSDGQVPWTHAFCCWGLTADLRQKLEDRITTLLARGWRFQRTANPSLTTVTAYLATLGLQPLGFLARALPRYTTAQRDALTGVADKTLIWNITTDRANVYRTATGWGTL
jgi:hypothetical protein